MHATPRPRISVEVTDSLHHKLKVIAAEQRTTMKDLVESALKIYLLGTNNTTSNHQAGAQ